jgi:hypothetical protein
MILTVNQINLLKKIIEEEVAIQYGSTSNYIQEQLSLGFIKKRLELSDYEETLLRLILTGSETGKLPSEQLRDKIIVSKIKANDSVEINRNNAGSILLKIDTNPNLIINTEVGKIKLSKLRYVYNLNFSELLNTTTNLEDLIAQLRQEIADLKSKLSQAENQNENFRLSIKELENQITELNLLITDLETQVSGLQSQISQLSEDYKAQIDQLLLDAKAQLDALRQEKDNLEKQKNEQIRDLQGKIDNFINLENLERDRIVIQDVFRYWVDVEREDVRVVKEQIRYDLADDLQYGAYIVDSLEPTVISDLTIGAMRAALNNLDFDATDTATTISARKVANDRHLLLNPENPSLPFFASVQTYLRDSAFDTGNARLVQESILMIDLINQNALNQQQTDKLLEFSKRKAPLLR